MATAPRASGASSRARRLPWMTATAATAASSGVATAATTARPVASDGSASTPKVPTSREPGADKRPPRRSQSSQALESQGRGSATSAPSIVPRAMHALTSAKLMDRSSGAAPAGSSAMRAYLIGKPSCGTPCPKGDIPWPFKGPPTPRPCRRSAGAFFASPTRRTGRRLTALFGKPYRASVRGAWRSVCLAYRPWLAPAHDPDRRRALRRLLVPVVALAAATTLSSQADPGSYRSVAASHNPLAGESFYVQPTGPAAMQALQSSYEGRPDDAAAMRDLAARPWRNGSPTERTSPPALYRRPCRPRRPTRSRCSWPTTFPDAIAAATRPGVPRPRDPIVAGSARLPAGSEPAGHRDPRARRDAQAVSGRLPRPVRAEREALLRFAVRKLGSRPGVRVGHRCRQLRLDLAAVTPDAAPAARWHPVAPTAPP